MHLKSILAQIRSLRVAGSIETDVHAVRYDSRTVDPGSVFVCLAGEHADGHKFIPQALEKGAAAIVIEKGRADAVPIDCAATVIEVEEPRIALAEMASSLFRQPTQKLKLAGVTGTNGKTTTTFLIKHLCDAAQLTCGLIGTVHYNTGREIIEGARTTPEASDLQELFAEMRRNKLRAAAMEVSSHAIEQNRIRGLEFDCAVFTNLTQDHLDYHKSMDAYFMAKSRWFAELLFYQVKKTRAMSIVNLDDRYGQQLIQRLERLSAPLVTFGQGARASYRANGIRSDMHGTSFQLEAEGKSYLVKIPLIGLFNVYNALGALAAASVLGVPLREGVAALANAPGVPGRLESVSSRRPFQVFVDYAHSPDALTNVLKTLRDLKPNRIITVFGCGGDRDRAKRPLMARAAEEYSDICLATSDNPRSEEPAAILADVEAGFQSRPYEIIVDRRDAIRRAITLAQPRDIILIAGKGHENYQEVKGVKRPFDDVQMAKHALDSKMLDEREEEPKP